MDKKIVKRMIIAGIFTVYTIVSISVFIVSGNVYMSGIKKKAIDENTYSVKIAKDFIDDEMNDLVKDANTAARDELLYTALKFGIKDFRYNPATNQFDAKKIDKFSELDYKKMANYLRDKVYGNTYAGFNERGIEIFDKNIVLLGNSIGFPQAFIDRDNNQNMPYFVRSGSSFIDNKGQKFYMKGIAEIYADSFNIMGYVLAGKNIDIFFLDKMKKMLNKEIILVKNDTIMLSTIYEGTERVEGVEIGNRKNNINYQKYNEYLVGERKFGVSFFPLLTPKNQLIAYVGVGYDVKNIEDIAGKSTKKMLPFIVVYALVSFLIIYLSTILLFRNFEKCE